MNDARPFTPSRPTVPLLRQARALAVGLCLGAGLISAQADPAVPAGVVMGAYGQSLQMAATVAPAVPAQQQPVTANNNSNDAVTRFMADQGLIAAPPQDRKLLDKVRDKASDLVLSAMNFLGVRYKYGGTTAENGFDCSGFTRHIFEMSVGLVLPRRADEQARSSSLLSIKKDELKPGDLVFFNTMRATFSHVGIYVGDGKFVHAPRTGAAIRVDDMREAYWSKRFTGARRAAEAHGAAESETLTR